MSFSLKANSGARICIRWENSSPALASFRASLKVCD